MTTRERVHHLPRDGRAKDLMEVARVLKPQGVMIVNVNRVCCL